MQIHLKQREMRSTGPVPSRRVQSLLIQLTRGDCTSSYTPWAACGWRLGLTCEYSVTAPSVLRRAPGRCDARALPSRLRKTTFQHGNAEVELQRRHPRRRQGFKQQLSSR